MHLIAFISILLVSTQAFGDECDLAASAIKPLIIDKSLTQYSTWNDSNKELRAILVDGNLLYVKYWACEHTGVQAQLIMPMFDWDKSVLERKIGWLSSLILNKRDAKLLMNSLKKHGGLNSTDQIEIDGTDYDAFWLDINSSDDTIVITIEYFY